MEKNNLTDGLMALMIEEEAWKDLSGNYPWNEAILEKYKDKVDWEEISSNCSIEWTVSMLERFKRNINWTELSRRANKGLLIPEVVERFKDRWDWKELSENSDLPIDTIRKMADYVDWRALVERGYRHDFSMAFLKEFEDRIPASSLKDSGLWRKIIEDKVDAIRAGFVLG